MLSIGEKLYQARTSQGLTLDQVAASTRISLKYLRALEQDERALFPGGFFYRSFLTQYVARLGLIDPEIFAEADRILSADAPLPLPGQGPEPQFRKVAPMPHPGRSIRFFAARELLGAVSSFVLVVTACAGLYSWLRDSRQYGVPTGSRPVAVLKPAAAEARVTPQASRLSLNLAARETTWLSVSSDGKPVFSGVLQANQSKALEAEARAKLVVGNAGGISVEWNGRQIGPIGPRGQVRVVTFTADSYRILTPLGGPRALLNDGAPALLLFAHQ